MSTTETDTLSLPPYGYSKSISESSFAKYDTGKIRYDLVPPSIIKGIAEILTFGAEKYGEGNWKKCEDANRYVAAMYRHLEAWRAGEELDPESGKSHLFHAGCCLAFLIELNYTPTDWR